MLIYIGDLDRAEVLVKLYNAAPSPSWITSFTRRNKTQCELARDFFKNSDIRNEYQECRYLVKDSGTSESPKSTHQRGKYFSLDCPASDIFALTAPGKMSSQ